MTAKTSVLFVSHGGGPLPLLGDPDHREMTELLGRLGNQLPRPAAILWVSAHWEAAIATVTAAEQPTLLYDYYGFPEEAYSIEYPCPGSAELSAAVTDVLQENGLAVENDKVRGLDHGVFVPAKLLYPDADIPCVQLSLLKGLDPAAHIRLGAALAQLDVDNLLVVGSGFSFHNLKAFFAPPSARDREMNLNFENWLQQTLTSYALTENERRTQLLEWEQAPGARFCHPREEHLLPVHVCYGLAGRPCSEHYPIDILGKSASYFYWGAEST